MTHPSKHKRMLDKAKLCELVTCQQEFTNFQNTLIRQRLHKSMLTLTHPI